MIRLPALTEDHGRKVVTFGIVALGAWGFAGSTTHVLHLARAHGQEGWLAWNVAGAVEFLALLAGWEIRMRARADQPAKFPKSVVAGTVVFVLAANLVQADTRLFAWDGWGYIVAVVAPLCFLAAAGLLETRPDRRAKRKGKPETPAPRAQTPRSAPNTGSRGSTEAKTAPRAAEPRTAPRPYDDDVAVKRTAKAAIVAELLDEARAAIAAGEGWDPDPKVIGARYGKSHRSGQDYVTTVKRTLAEEAAA